MYIAIKSAAVCSSGISPDTQPLIKKDISSAESFIPSLFFFITSYIRIIILRYIAKLQLPEFPNFRISESRLTASEYQEKEKKPGKASGY